MLSPLGDTRNTRGSRRAEKECASPGEHLEMGSLSAHRSVCSILLIQDETGANQKMIASMRRSLHFVFLGATCKPSVCPFLSASLPWRLGSYNGGPSLSVQKQGIKKVTKQVMAKGDCYKGRQSLLWCMYENIQTI